MKNRLVRFFLVAAWLGVAPFWAQAEEPIKIGACFALSGPQAPSGIAGKLVAEIVKDEINENGGINGQPIELVVGDTESDPNKAASIAQKFVSSDNVAAIIGPTSTDEALQVKKIAEEAGIPTEMTVGGDQPIMKETGPFSCIFKSPQRSSTAVKKLYGYLKEKKLTKVALFTAADDFGMEGSGWLTRLAPDYGITLVAAESFGPKDTDLTAQFTKINNAAPQAIVVWTIGPAGAILAKNKAKLGIKAPLFQSHGQPGPEYLLLAGKAAEGDRMPATRLLVVDQLPDTDLQKPVIQKFIRLYKDTYHFDRRFPINTDSGSAWDALYIVANAMKKAGTSHKALRSAIEQTRGYVGISGIYNLTPEDHNGLDVDSLVMVQVKDGKFRLAD
ncbi:MAG: ABC transporter substrate-binding protein [Desulfobaccales bacterium]